MSSAVGTNNKAAPSVAQAVAGIGPDTNLHTLSTDNSGVLNVNAAIVIPPGTVVIADQGTPNTDANAWPVKLTNGTDSLTINPDGSIDVNIISGISNPLPVQDSAAEASLASIDSELQAFSAKTAGALVPEAFDYQDITYVGATTRINTVVYKTGGSGGTVVATLTMGYDGNDRLTSVTKT